MMIDFSIPGYTLAKIVYTVKIRSSSVFIL